MKKAIIVLLIIVANYSYAQKNVGIGTVTPDPSATLDVVGNDKGVLFPRISDTLNINSPAAGLFIYHTPDSTYRYFDGIIWRKIFATSVAGINAGVIDTDVDSAVLVGYSLIIYENGNTAVVNLSSIADSAANTVYSNIADTLLNNQTFIDSLISQMGGPEDDIDSANLVGFNLSIYEDGSIALVNLSSIADSAVNTVYSNIVDTLFNNQAFLDSLSANTGGADDDLDSANLVGYSINIYEDASIASVNLSPIADSAANTVYSNIVDTLFNNQTFLDSLSANTSSGGNDADWFIENSVNTPNNISDNIYTNGFVGIGKIDPDDALDVVGDIDLPVNNAIQFGNNDFIHRRGFSNVFAGISSGDSVVSTNNSGTTLNNSVGIGAGALSKVNSGSGLVAIGSNALRDFETGFSNVAVGNGSQRDNIDGTSNVTVGQSTLRSITTGSNNIFIGNSAGQNVTNSEDNVVLGGAGFLSGSGSKNVFIGRSSGAQLAVQKDSNVYIGYSSGRQAEGSRNVFIGFQAGEFEGFSDKLYIENSSSQTPLIYGEFNNNIVRINNNLQVSDPSINGYGFPNIDGSNGQVLTTNGNGVVTWQTVTSGSSGTDNQNLSVGTGTSSTSIIEIEDGTNITLQEGANISLTESSNTITIAATVPSDLNFAHDDLIATGSRIHDFENNALTINDASRIILEAGNAPSSSANSRLLLSGVQSLPVRLFHQNPSDNSDVAEIVLDYDGPSSISPGSSLGATIAYQTPEWNSISDGAILQKSDATSSEYTQYALPNIDGAAGEILITDGVGNVTWQSPNSGNSVSEISICEFFSTEVVTDGGGMVMFVVPSSMNGKSLEKVIARGSSGTGTTSVAVRRNGSIAGTLSNVGTAFQESTSLFGTLATGDLITVTTASTSGVLNGLSVTINVE